MQLIYLLFFLIIAFQPAFKVEGAFTLYQGKIANVDEVPEYSAEKHYDLAVCAFSENRFTEAAHHFNIIVCNFPNTSIYYESLFYLGVSYYYEREYDFANEAFSKYLNCQSNPEYFEQAIGFKLAIADCFRGGAKKRFFSTKMLPKWASGRSAAKDIYNEVITALPCHEYAAQALFSKGCYHWEDQCFKESVESFQMLIRRFPKHELAPYAYLCINQVYLNQAEVEFQNPDILSLAQINFRKFQKDFPREERLEEAACLVQDIKEMYARGLFETGQFYERTCHPEASIIYYRSTIQKFPDTYFARCSQTCLRRLCPEEECVPSS